MIEGQSFHALYNLNMEIRQGEMIAIMGPSGSGKSTLLNILGGMDVPSSGGYYFNDVAVNKLSSGRLHQFRKNNVSFVFQHFALMNHYTVYENVEMPLIPKHISRGKRKQIVMEKLEMLHIAEQAKKYPTQLSGGQQQRCAIARALASDNSLILADEPTGALDVSTGEEIMTIFQQIKQMGKTVVIVTHDEKISQKCERVLVIEDGKLKI